MNPNLRRHLVKAFGAKKTDFDVFLEPFLAAPEGSPQRQLALGLSILLPRISSSFDQMERDLELRGRSLEISSQEMVETYDRLRSEFDRQKTLTEAMRLASQVLSGSDELSFNTAEEASLNLQRAAVAHQSALLEVSVLQKALDQHSIVSATDSEGEILWVNDNFCRTSGYSREELIGKNHRIINSGILPRAFFTNLWQTISSGKVWSGEIVNRTKSGDIYWVQATIVPILDAQGRVERYIAARTDITELKKAQALVQQQANLVEALFENIPLPVFLLNTKREFVKANKEFCSELQITPDDFLGRRFEQLSHTALGRLHLLPSPEAASNIRNGSFEATFARADGSVANVLITRAELTGSEVDGAHQGTVGVVIDLTNVKKATSDLLAAKSAAESANRLKSEFLANMSHEIRTPINGIIGMTDLALEVCSDPTQKEYLSIAKNSARALLSIINDILDFSKIEAGKMTIEAVEFDFPKLVNETLRPMAIKAAEKKLVLAVDIDPSCPKMLIADPGRLRQVLLNLVSNAIKFTRVGEVLIRATAKIETDIAWVDISVKDSGVGISSDKIDTIFKAFSQEDTTITRRFGGTGLGLTICEKLCEAMGGSIEAHSVLDQGSTFHVHIPMRVSRATRSVADDTVTLKAGLRVAAIDDNLTNSGILKRQLSSFGATCESFFDPMSALVSISARPDDFDVIIVDRVMPEMDGFEFCDRLGSALGTRTPPIMMVTSAGAPGDLELCRKVGINAYLLKPCLTSEVKSALQATLNRATPALQDAPRKVTTRHDIAGPEGFKVLVVEDNFVNQKLATTWLMGWGMPHVVANHGQEALDLVRSRSFDLILMDCQMPVMDGFEATRRIRNLPDPRSRSTPIIAMTANAIEGDRERCLDAGMDDYVSKPISPPILRAAIERWGRRDDGLSQRSALFDFRKALDSSDSETIEIIGKAFIEAMRSDLPKMHQALELLDWRELSRLAHSAKGLCMTFGATPLSTAFGIVETLSLMDDPVFEKIHEALSMGCLGWPDFEMAMTEKLSKIRS